MAQVILLKKSNVAGTVPLQLAVGELAINTVDKMLYAGTPSGVRAIKPPLPDAAAYTYDASGSVTSQVETFGLVTRTTTYTYDSNGNVATVIIADGIITRTETYTYNVNGLLTGMTATEI